jgi:DNA-binding transcriptional LysR family regulator
MEAHDSASVGPVPLTGGGKETSDRPEPGGLTAHPAAHSSAALDVWQLRYFVAVAEALHFGRAAERLHVSQPSLSRQIQHLERELGVLLLNRDKHTVVLTAAGWALLHEARQIVGMTQRAERIVRSVGNKPAGVLRIGVSEPLSWIVNSLVLRRMAERYPAVHPSLEDMSAADQISALRYRQLDIAMVWEAANPNESTGEFERLELWEDDPWVVMAPTSELAKKSVVGREDLASQKILLWRRRESPALYDELLHALRSWGVSQQPVIGDSSGLLTLTRAGLGVALAPYHAAQLVGDLVARPLAEAILKFRAVLVWRRAEKTPALRGYVEIAKAIRDSGLWSDPVLPDAI